LSGRIRLVFNCQAIDTTYINYYFKGLSQEHVIIDSVQKYTICDSIPESIYPVVIYVKERVVENVEFYNEKHPKVYEKLKRKMFN